MEASERAVPRLKASGTTLSRGPTPTQNLAHPVHKSKKKKVHERCNEKSVVSVRSKRCNFCEYLNGFHFQCFWYCIVLRFFYFVYFEVNFCSSYPSLGKCYFIYGCPNVSDCLRCQSVYPPFCIPVVVSLFTITPKHNNDLVRLTPLPSLVNSSNSIHLASFSLGHLTIICSILFKS